MIFDWISNCENIYNTKHFSNSDAQEKKTMTFQHIILFKYLEDIKKYTKEEVKDFWLKTDSPFLSAIPKDEYESWSNIEFNKLWKMRDRNSINFLADNQMVYNFPIYQQEIDYINSLDCTSWYKKALLLMLGCAKHNSTGLLKYNYTTTAWIEKMIDPKKKVRDKMQNIGILNSKYQLFKFAGMGARANYIKLRFIEKEGDIATIVYSPNEMKDALELIHADYKICERCKNKFLVSSKSQTNLCNSCYAEYRKEKERARVKKYRDNKKNGDVRSKKQKSI